MAYVWMTYVGVAKNRLGSYEQAIAWFRRAIEANRNYPLTYFALAAALAQLGRPDEARSAVKGGLALNPAFSVSRARAAWTALSDDPTYLAQAEQILEGLRKAGVPEQWSSRPPASTAILAADCRRDARSRTSADTQNAEPGAVVLRRDRQEAQEAAAHCLLRTEAATLGDPFDRQA